MQSPPPTPQLPRGAPYSSHDLTHKSRWQYASVLSPPPTLPSPSHSTPQPHSPLPTSSPRTSPQHVLRFTSCRLIRSHHLHTNTDLWVQGHTIIDPADRFWQASKLNEFAADETVDCKGLILAPGYIDVQINGAFGVDFTRPDGWREGGGEEEGGGGDEGEGEGKEGGGEKGSRDGGVVERGLTKVAVGILPHGVTSFCPTIITSSARTYASLLPLYQPRRGSPTLGAHILGIHCEGPFITKQGAHTERLMHRTAVTASSLEQMYGVANLPHIRIITVAPEIDGMMDALAYTHAHHPHVVLSAGHSSASFDTALLATRHGVSLLTHLFNAMVPFTHRDPGIVGLIGSNDVGVVGSGVGGLKYSLITDDIHTHQASVMMAYRCYPQGCVVITDAMAAMGLESGVGYHIGESRVTIVEGVEGVRGKVGRRRAVVTGTDVLAGSVATMEECVREMRRATGCSVVEAVEAGSLHAAEALGLKEKGRLDVGCDADLLLLDDDMVVHGVWIAGQLAWLRPGSVDIREQE